MKFNIDISKSILLPLVTIILLMIGGRNVTVHAINYDATVTEDVRNDSWNWSHTDVLTNDSTVLSDLPDTALDANDNLHVVWYDATDKLGAGTDTDIFYRRYFETNSSWSDIELVSSDSIESSYTPAMAIDSKNNIHIAWHDNTDYNGAGTDTDIFYKMYDQSTNTWSDTMIVSTVGSNTGLTPDIIADKNDNIHIVWHDSADYDGNDNDKDIFHKMYNPTTSSWSSIFVMSNQSTVTSEFASIKADNFNNIHVIWQDYTDIKLSGTDADIFYRKFDAGTNSWANISVISTESTSDSLRPDFSIDTENNIHVVWSDSTDYNGAGTDSDIFYKNLSSVSNTWSSTEIVSLSNNGNSAFPSITTDIEDNLHISWQDDTDLNGAGLDYDIFYKKFISSSSLWTGTFDLSANSENSIYPVLVSDKSGVVHLTWSDQTDYTEVGTDRDIFYRNYAGVPNSPTIDTLNSDIGYDYVGLSWSQVPYANSYNIYRFKTSMSDATLVRSTSDNTYFDDPDDTGTFSYYITAQNIVGESDSSNVILVDVSINNVSEDGETSTVTTTVTTSGSSSNDTEDTASGFLSLTPYAVVGIALVFIAIVRIRKSYSS